YDINDEALEEARKRFKVLMERYQEDEYGTKQQVEDAYKRITLFTDLAKAVEHADLVIEAVPELIEVKEEFYKKLSKVAPKDTIFASNSSTMVPSQLVGFTDRPEKFLHFHFVNEIWRLNIAEVMRHKNTDPKVFDQMIEFARAIGMVPTPLQK